MSQEGGQHCVIACLTGTKGCLCAFCRECRSVLLSCILEIFRNKLSYHVPRIWFHVALICMQHCMVEIAIT